MFGFVLPIITFNKNGIISEKEKRNLATLPYLICDNRLNDKLFSEYSSYFNDRFGGRQALIKINSKLKYDVFKASIYNDRALRGKDNWWFYTDKDDGNNLSDFYKNNLFNDEQIVNFEQSVMKVSNWCKEKNIPFVFLICPNKHSVYEEYYPFDRPEGITRADQITQIFDEIDVPYIFPRDFLISKKAEYDFPLYYETDTHWNPLGAYLVSILLQEKIESFFPSIDFPKIEYEIKNGYSMTLGDILPMLGIETAKSTRPVLSPIGHEYTDYYEFIKYEGKNGENGIHTKGQNKSLPRILIYRDSFFVALEPFVSPIFSEAECKWKYFRDDDKKYILEYKPDIIIFESVERCAPSMVN